ncbi:MAG: DUF1016 family protein [Planctomycetia bacterium]|nr:DUF1016 family protein [Planctomycetia bacterium]
MKQNPSATLPGTAVLPFTGMVDAICAIHHQLQKQAARAINAGLTLRNWLIGWHIHEFEQHGADRAAYGTHLLEKLAAQLQEQAISRCEQRELRRYRLFYQLYPQIRDSLNPDFHNLLPAITLEPTAIREALTPISGKDLLTRLSFTHINELLQIDSPEKRAFYERECIQGSWSVRELKRQISSLLYERSELSLDRQKLAAQTQKSAEPDSPALTIRDPYVFEFLGLTPREVMTESHLEDQLLDRLQNFLLELGQGFCFEARQRRILIGDTYHFVDLVFYHRILKCHVLVELKLERFTHENIGQLNTYVSWFDRQVRTTSDNPPIGILLCTDKDHALVEYALAGMDNKLFVSKYQLELPSKELLQKQIETEKQRLEAEQP